MQVINLFVFLPFLTNHAVLKASISLESLGFLIVQVSSGYYLKIISTARTNSQKLRDQRYKLGVTMLSKFQIHIFWCLISIH